MTEVQPAAASAAPPSAIPTPVAPVTAPAANPFIRTAWQIGGVFVVASIVLNVVGFVVERDQVVRAGGRVASDVPMLILLARCGLAAVVAAGLFGGKEWAKWLAWVGAAVTAVFLVYIGQSVRPDHPVPGAAYYAAAAALVVGWFLLLDRGAKPAVNIAGAVLAGAVLAVSAVVTFMAAAAPR